jgi:hypothetical protein
MMFVDREMHYLKQTNTKQNTKQNNTKQSKAKNATTRESARNFIDHFIVSVNCLRQITHIMISQPTNDLKMNNKKLDDHVCFIF